MPILECPRDVKGCIQNSHMKEQEYNIVVNYIDFVQFIIYILYMREINQTRETAIYLLDNIKSHKYYITRKCSQVHSA